MTAAVHQTHCCAIHGCKYGDDDCPVESFDLTQSYPCEECDTDPPRPPDPIPTCQCIRCLNGMWELTPEDKRPVFPPPSMMMILCPTCGNKRCPHASDHRNDCTGSNEPNQPGSVYQTGPTVDEMRERLAFLGYELVKPGDVPSYMRQAPEDCWTLCCADASYGPCECANKGSRAHYIMTDERDA